MKIRLDDEREAPEGRRGYKEFQRFSRSILINWDVIDEISFDHDLGQDYDGYDVLVWFVQTCKLLDIKPKISIHSANPVGRKRMERVIEEFYQ